MIDNRDVYFAADDAENCTAKLQEKCDVWFNTMVENRYVDKIKRSWNAYYGLYFQNDDEIGFSGEQGELVELAINHYRSIAEVQLNLITSNRPSFQARSINTDSKSQIQTTLANGLLEYYMREKRLEKYLKNAVESAIIMGSGYVKMEWNATSGEIFDYIDPTPRFSEEAIDRGDGIFVNKEGKEVQPLLNSKGNLVDDSGRELKPFPIYQGDVKFSNLSPLDVVFDSTKESSEDHDWVVCRSFKNKFDLAAKYPSMADQILAQRTKDDYLRNKIYLSPLDETVDIPVYEFFHRKSESMPEGRYILYVATDVILMDSPMPYRMLPIYRIAPSDIMGTPYGYTTMFALLPIQDAVNTLYSTALTNQNAHGVQNILNPMGNGITPTHLENGMNFINYNPNVGPPTALNLTATPKEIFSFMQMLEKAMETISGINSVARGNPDKNLSGTALALIQSQALQFISGLQHSYIQLLEDVGTGLIKLLQDFAEVPRVAEIVGISNTSKVKEFKNEDIDSINRVVVDVGNALSTTTAGRIQMADNLIQMGLIKSPEQYFAVMNTGRLDVMTQSTNDQLILIQTENEVLLNGSSDIIVVDTDDHALHVREHRAILNDASRRISDPDFLQRTLVHIQEHIDALRSVDPDLLAILQQQPLGPVGGSPVSQDNAAAPQPQSKGQVDEITAQPQGEQLSTSAGLPKPAKPPLNPQTGQPF